MKKMTKQLFAVTLLIFAVMALLPKAQAQANYTVLLPGGTNNIAADTNKVYSLDAVAMRSQQVSLLLSFKLSGAGTEPLSFTFAPTDGAGNVSTISDQAVVFSVPAAGTGTVNFITNWNWGAIPGYRLTGITNGNTNAFATNITVKVISKTGL